jgi:ATP-dependent Clp protease ATP-binding subunit ClpA
MFERFTDQSRRAVVLAQEEARRLDHRYIGTEHLLLGLRREDQGAAGRALGSADITLEAVRGAVETLVGRGQAASASGHIPFTPRAKKCLELSLREALKLSHRYIGTGHLLLALISSDGSTAVQVLGELGADLEQLRAQVVTDIEDHPERPLGSPPPSAVSWLRRGPLAEPILGLLNMIEDRLSAIERHLGITPAASPAPGELRGYDKQIVRVRQEKAEALASQDFEKAAALREREMDLLAERARAAEGLAAGSPAEGEAGQSSRRPDELARLQAEVTRLQAEVTRLQALLREHEIDPGAAAG